MGRESSEARVSDLDTANAVTSVGWRARSGLDSMSPMRE